jgi:hypothetical protein
LQKKRDVENNNTSAHISESLQNLEKSLFKLLIAYKQQQQKRSPSSAQSKTRPEHYLK